MRRNPARRALQVAGFHLNSYGSQSIAVRAAFDHDLRPRLRHHAEQPVAVHDSERLDRSPEHRERPRQSRSGLNAL